MAPFFLASFWFILVYLGVQMALYVLAADLYTFARPLPLAPVLLVEERD